MTQEVSNSPWYQRRAPTFLLSAVVLAGGLATYGTPFKNGLSSYLEDGAFKDFVDAIQYPWFFAGVGLLIYSLLQKR